jgi:glycosyltransferase involved in cell wall biosynthesis
MASVSGTSAPPLAVLVNAIHAKAGGGVTYLNHLLPELARRGIVLHLLIHPAQRAKLAPAVACAVLHEAAMPTGFLSLLAWEQVHVPRWFRRLGCDVLLSPANYGPLRVRRQVLVLHTALGVARFERRLGMRLYWLGLALMTHLSLRVAKGAIAVSRFVAESIGANRAEIVSYGVAGFAPDGATQREDFLLAVGDLYPQKNYHALIEALSRLPARRLVIAGEAIDAQYARRLQALVAAQRLGERVTFLGRVGADKLADLYRRCAVFVFPSLVESFGMPLLEAMASGAPIACAKAAAMPEVAGEAALYFDPKQPYEIAATLNRLLDAPGLAASLGKKAAERARSFTWEAAAASTEAVLRRVAGKG